MKKIAFVLALSLVLACFLPLTASASVFRSLRSVLDEKSEECRVLLSDSSTYQPYRQYIDGEYEDKILTPSMVDHEFILEFYEPNSMNTAHLSPEERISLVSQNCRYFLSFGDKIRKICRYDNDDGSTVVSWIWTYEWEELPMWARDIFFGSETQTICGVKCNIKDIICFVGASGAWNDSIYYVTDQGTFVRDYNDSARQFELPLADYQRYSVEAWDYYLDKLAITGERPYGGESIMIYHYRTMGNRDLLYEMQVTYYVPARLILHGCICVLIAAGGVTTVVLLGRRKRKAKSEIND